MTTYNPMPLLLLLLAFVPCAAEDKSDKPQRIARCEAIPWSDYQSWMIFNPSDLQTLYRRSQGLQKLAVSVRDITLCNRVRERKAMFLDGSGISAQRCRSLVNAQITRDSEAAQQLGELHRLRQLRLARNGNGRDIDIHMVTRGDTYNRYRLTLVLHEQQGKLIGTLYDKVQTLGQGEGEVVLFIPQSELLQLIGTPGVAREYEIVATLQPELDAHKRFVLQHLDEGRRKSTLHTVVNFSRLERTANW